MILPLPAPKPADPQDRPYEAVHGNGNPDVHDPHLQRACGDVDQADAQAPHADYADEQGKAHIAGATADAAGNDEEAEKYFRSGCDKQCLCAQDRYIRITCE